MDVLLLLLTRPVCACRYYEAFPPLSEKPVCLQEIMTVWNKAKACAYSTSSSSAAPQTSTDTSSPKDCNSDGEAAKEQHPPSGGGVASVTGDRGLQRRSKKEKENQQHGCAAAEKKASAHPKRPSRHRPEGKYRARSWSSGSSEAGSSSSGNQGDAKASRSRTLRVRHRSREAAKSKRTRNSGQAKAADREERRHAGGSGGGGSSAGGGPAKAPALYKKGKRLLKELQKDPGWKDAKEATLLEALKKKEYMEEPLWYTEPIADYFVPFSGRQSKLETKYRSAADLPRGLALPAQVEALPEEIQGVCVASEGRQRAYLAAGSFVDGHFVEGPGEDEAPEPSATSGLPPPEGSGDLDDEHLSEFTHFYEVDIYQSMLDTSASDSVQESRILSMIRQKSREQRDAPADCPPASDGLEQRGKSAIRPESADGAGSLGFLMEDLESMAQVWGCCSPSTSEDIDGESLVGDSPVRLSPLLDSVSFALSAISGYVEEPAAAAEASSQAYAVNASCFSLFELQYDSPTFSFPREPPAAAAHDHADCLHPLSNKQSRLLIWTKNSAFEEAEHCSNLSTRTCSPWSHSEETRSDNEQQANVQAEDSAQVDRVIPPLSAAYLEDEILDFLQGSAVHKCEEASGSAASGDAFAKKSKLESVCGIALEEDESERYVAAAAAAFPDDRSPRSHDYSSGIIKDIWTAIGQDEAARQGEGPFPDEPGAAYCCGCLEVQATGQQVPAPQTKAVQRSEYHLWDSKKEEQDLAKNQASSMDGAGDYTTPSKPWDLTPDREGTSFLLGGVYGELKSLGGDKSWAVLPPGHAQSSLLQCAASDVLTIAGGCFAPGHRPLWRPLVSFGQSEQAVREGADGPNKGFSFIFREDLLGPYGRLRGEEPGVDYPFASFSLNNPFSQVLHVECSFESEDVASFSPGFKPRSILCSEPEDEAFHSRIYGLNRTQYRAIRISPRTHFRPISASELSPGGASDSEAETDKEEAAFPALAPADVFDDPQADLKPLEEDAECEGPYYGKSELESGKFLPRLKKSGMEKSAQTSLDSQEGTGGLQEAGAAGEPRTDAAPGQKPAGAGPRHGMASDRVGMAPEVSLLFFSHLVS